MKLYGRTWKDVESASSKWDYFEINFKDGTPPIKEQANIRCIKRREFFKFLFI